MVNDWVGYPVQQNMQGRVLRLSFTERSSGESWPAPVPPLRGWGERKVSIVFTLRWKAVSGTKTIL